MSVKISKCGILTDVKLDGFHCFVAGTEDLRARGLLCGPQELL